MTLMIEVAVVRRNAHGEVWRATWPGGDLESRTPFFAAARALLAAGVDPATQLEMRHAGSAIVALRSTVGEAARWAVREEPLLEFERYREHTPSSE